MKKPSEVLRGAIQEIKTRGWCVDEFEQYATGAVCLLGGVNAAAYQKPYGPPDRFVDTQTEGEEGDLQQVLNSALVGVLGMDPADWNDEHAADVEEVYQALEAAAEIAEIIES